MSQTTNREHDAGRQPAVPSHRATEESNVSNPTHVFRSTGWHLDGDEAVYLHAGGAMGRSGAVAGIRMGLDPGLDRFTLPDPPHGDELRRAVRASLSLLAVASDPISVGLLGMVYRAPLGQVDFSGFLVGPTGAGKSELAAVAQQHYGASMDRLHLPACWMSTAAALQAMAHRAKDALLVIDDFEPMDGHRVAERLLSRQYNAPTQTPTPTRATGRPPMPPQALLLGTGGALPRGRSLPAHVLALHVKPRDVNWRNLSVLQEKASSGMFAAAMAGYLRWLAATYDDESDHVNVRFQELRRILIRGAVHPRTPDMIGSLAVGLERFLQFAEHVEAVDASRRRGLWVAIWSALVDLGEAQAQHFPLDARPGRRSGRSAGDPTR